MEGINKIKAAAKDYKIELAKQQFSSIIADDVIMAIPVDSERELEKYNSKEFKNYAAGMIKGLIEIHEASHVSEITNLASLLYSESAVSVEGFDAGNYVESLCLAVREVAEDETLQKRDKLIYGVQNGLISQESLDDAIAEQFGNYEISIESVERLEVEKEMVSVESDDFIEAAKATVIESMEITKEKQEIIEEVNTEIVKHKEEEIDEKTAKAKEIVDDKSDTTIDDTEESTEMLKQCIPVSPTKFSDLELYSNESYAALITRVGLSEIHKRLDVLDDRISYENDSSLTAKFDELKARIDNAGKISRDYNNVLEDLRLTKDSVSLEHLDEIVPLLNVIVDDRDPDVISLESLKNVELKSINSKEDLLSSLITIANINLGIESIAGLDEKIEAHKVVADLEELVFVSNESANHKELVNNVLKLSDVSLRKAVEVNTIKNRLNLLLKELTAKTVGEEVSAQEIMDKFSFESADLALVEAVVNGTDISETVDDTFFKIASSIAGNRMIHNISNEGVDWTAVTNKAKVWTTFMYSFEGLGLLSTDMKNTMLDHFIADDK